MTNMRNLSTLCLFMTFYLLRIKAFVGSVPGNNYVIPNGPGQAPNNSDKPAILFPNDPCTTEFINGKKIINNNINKEECQRRAYEKGQQQQHAAINAAVQAMKMVAKLPPKKQECIRTVSNASQECLKNKIKKRSQTKPRYIVASNSNKTVIFDGKKIVFIGLRTQSHYTLRHNKGRPFKVVTDYPFVVVFNEYGEAIASKTPVSKKKPYCICPGINDAISQPTREGLLSDCIKQECSGNGIITNILSNATVDVSNDGEGAKSSPENKDKDAEPAK